MLHIHFRAVRLVLDLVAPITLCCLEDSVAGVTAVVAGGMPVLGFVGGSHCDEVNSERLLEADARCVFCNMTELPLLL